MTKEQIKELRNNLDLSQAKFADKIGVTVFTVHRWEKGKSNPSPMALEKLKHMQFRYRQNNPIRHIGKTEQMLGLDRTRLNEIRDLIPRNKL